MGKTVAPQLCPTLCHVLATASAMHAMAEGPTLADAADLEDFEDMDAEDQVLLAQISWTEPNMTTGRGQGTSDSNEVVKATVFLSVAEEAIARTTGVKPGKGEDRQCWRCHGLARLTDMLPHLSD